METAKITAKGQITIPKRVRDALSVGSGDRLAFEFDDRRGVRVTPVQKVLKPLRGFLAEHAGGRVVDDAQIRAALRRRAAGKFSPR